LSRTTLGATITRSTNTDRFPEQKLIVDAAFRSVETQRSRLAARSAFDFQYANVRDALKKFSFFKAFSSRSPPPGDNLNGFNVCNDAFVRLTLERRGASEGESKPLRNGESQRVAPLAVFLLK